MYKYNTKYYRDRATKGMIDSVARIKETMLDAGITQMEIARLTGYNFRKINKFFALNTTYGLWKILKRKINDAIIKFMSVDKIIGVIDSLNDTKHIYEECTVMRFGASIDIIGGELGSSLLLSDAPMLKWESVGTSGCKYLDDLLNDK
jgi:hypothetical protein